MNAQDLIYTEVKRYFGNTLQKYGATGKGVDWNGNESQELRFQQFLRCLPTELIDAQASVADFGCGYGGFLSYLRERQMNCRYVGVDCVQAMIDEAHKQHKTDTNSEFSCAKVISSPTDYVIASGVFNARFDFSHEEWTQYVKETLNNFHEFGRSGFVFNLLTSYSDSDKMRPDLYYADPCFYFDFCKRNFSKNVALLHDYGAYEFTIFVRK